MAKLSHLSIRAAAIGLSALALQPQDAGARPDIRTLNAISNGDPAINSLLRFHARTKAGRAVIDQFFRRGSRICTRQDTEAKTAAGGVIATTPGHLLCGASLHDYIDQYRRLNLRALYNTSSVAVSIGRVREIAQTAGDKVQSSRLVRVIGSLMLAHEAAHDTQYSGALAGQIAYYYAQGQAPAATSLMLAMEMAGDARMLQQADQLARSGIPASQVNKALQDILGVPAALEIYRRYQSRQLPLPDLVRQVQNTKRNRSYMGQAVKIESHRDMPSDLQPVMIQAMPLEEVAAIIDRSAGIQGFMDATQALRAQLVAPARPGSVSSEPAPRP